MSNRQGLAPVLYRSSPLQRNRCFDLREQLRTRPLDACVSRLTLATAAFATFIAVSGGIVCAPAVTGALANVSAIAATSAVARAVTRFPTLFVVGISDYFLNLKFA